MGNNTAEHMPAKEESIERLGRLLQNSRRIVAFTGAGCSTESNVPDFRSQEGLYSETQYPYPPETMLSSQFFWANPKEFYRFYLDKMLYPNARPNKAHLAFAHLEGMGRLTAVVTQNIDGLHQMAGSKTVLELHGSVFRNYCTKCGHFFTLEQLLELTHQGGKIPCCPCGGIVKPDVVLYGESLDDAIVEAAIRHISQADTLLVGGTSLAVYPAAGLLRYFKGETLILLNKTPTSCDHLATAIYRQPIGEVLKEAVLQRGTR